MKKLSKRWLLRLIFGSLSSFVLFFVLFMVLIAAMFAGLNDKKGGGSDCDITGSISATGNFNKDTYQQAWSKYFTSGVLKDEADYTIKAANKAGVSPTLLRPSWDTKVAGEKFGCESSKQSVRPDVR